ncbi:hypothetical protein DPEC_G00144070 [Dallia pectoralis]|uniref:Uncharacterized protein n=1 Tax=Dallia pectoralis TaxID=75939 RepID=A0ACC2GNF0_DALPE|nr:hypothetical protein DPEC_G00144070 [Dallia pectoralis]
MVSGNDSIVGCGAVATSPSRGRSIPGSGNYRARARDIGTSEGLAPERDRLTKRGLSADVIRTIQSARASSTSTLYSNRWSMFVRWCETNTMDPVCCPVEQILSFLQYLLDKRRSASTIKGYAAAISACHEGFGNKTVFSHSLVKRFLTGTRRLRPVARASVPQWDLSTVLNALCAPPFEPLSQISLRLLSLKTALLLALCSTKRYVVVLQSKSMEGFWGKVAPPGYIPWQVLLSNPRGGGMVIGEYWIMTAAHNLHGNTGYKVYVGVNNLLNLPEPLEIASIVLHPKYNGSKGDYDHDIALIYLKHSISFNTNVMPLCLPTNYSKYPTGKNGLVSGFGLMESDMSTNDLMYAQIPVVDQKTCRKSIENMNRSLTDNMFCAGVPEGGVDSCQGDSGGPYVLKEKEQSWAAGIVSWGINCGESGKYGVYTRVANYIDWIKKTMEE